MSGRCPVCGEKRTVRELEDGSLWCDKCSVPLRIMEVRGGAVLVVDRPPR